MAELLKSKKFISVLVAAAVQLILLIVANFFPDISPELVIKVAGIIAGLFGVQIAGQAFADGKTGGLTSHKSAEIVKLRQAELEVAKAENPLPPVSPPPSDSLLGTGHAPTGG